MEALGRVVKIMREGVGGRRGLELRAARTHRVGVDGHGPGSVIGHSNVGATMLRG